MKLALLLGCSGSGKGFIADSVSPQQLIRIDKVRREVLRPLRELLKYDTRNRWPVWNALLPHFGVDAQFHRAIRTACPALCCDKHLLAEGGLLAHNGFREAFLHALRSMGAKPVSTKMFWIDLDECTVVRQRQRRGRNNDNLATIQKVAGEIEHYRRHAAKLDCHRSSNSDELIAAIREFMASPPND